ncbi:hypothetical protein AVEN_118207-1 [Araneus ventricosus]|uniref:Uncharacterized protein n=1 Tax=Araneus ventricosus TaxID=182803 RepID=A0A4Y2QVM9_ARAVE|nr:hypothetical protein AVEN_118207-1 [Araneus ventricosus]
MMPHASFTLARPLRDGKIALCPGYLTEWHLEYVDEKLMDKKASSRFPCGHTVLPPRENPQTRLWRSLRKPVIPMHFGGEEESFISFVADRIVSCGFFYL